MGEFDWNLLLSHINCLIYTHLCILCNLEALCVVVYLTMGLSFI
jgi:hypothetical protein